MSTEGLEDLLPPLAEKSRRVFLIRHGETDWNARGLIQGGGFDTELNEAGLGQAKRLGETLNGLSITFGTVASSHLMRSQQTAGCIIQELDNRNSVVFMALEDLGEMRFGDLEGMAIRGPESTTATRQKVERLHGLMHDDTSLAWPGKDGESIAMVEERSKKGIKQILKIARGDHLCIVAHGRWNKIFLAQILSDKDKNKLGKQHNGCINVLDVDEHGKWNPCILNYVAHLEE